MIVPAPLADVLDRTFLYNSLRAWLTAAVTTTVIFVVLLLLRGVLHSRIAKLAARTTLQFDDMIVELLGATRTWVLFVLSLLAGTHTLNLGRADACFCAKREHAFFYAAAFRATHDERRPGGETPVAARHGDAHRHERRQQKADDVAGRL